MLTFGQQDVIIWKESRPLQWADFLGAVKDTSEYDAESFAEVTYHYTFKGPKNFSFEVQAGFNKNSSWFRKQTCCGDLLKHEQIHFDIAELFARKMREMFERYDYSQNFPQEIVEIFNIKKDEYWAMQLRYDEETNHSLNKKKQKEWENYIHNQLAQMSDKLPYNVNYATTSLPKSSGFVTNR